VICREVATNQFESIKNVIFAPDVQLDGTVDAKVCMVAYFSVTLLCCIYTHVKNVFIPCRK